MKYRSFVAWLLLVSLAWGGEDAVQREVSAGSEPYRDIVWCAILAIEFFVGVLIAVFHGSFDGSIDRQSFVFAVTCWSSFAHVPLQFAPFLTLTGYFGGVSCSRGLAWEMHAAYFAVLMMALPFLANLDQGHAGLEKAKIPILGCGGVAYKLYLLLATIANAADQYLDTMATCIAFACGFSKAYYMLAVLIVSFVVQAGSAFCISESDGLLLALMGMSPDGMALGTKTRTMTESFQKAAAALGIAKLFTENLPQGILQIQLMEESGASSIVYLSVGFSIVLGCKSALAGCKYFTGPQQAVAPESESESESE